MLFRILAVSEHNDTVTLGQEAGLGCFGCMGQGRARKKPSFTAANPRALHLAPGQIAEVETPRSSVIIQSLGALLPPAAGFLGGFAGARLAAPQGGDPLYAALGAAGLFAAAALTYWVRRRFPGAITSRVTQVWDGTAAGCSAPPCGGGSPGRSSCGAGADAGRGE
ncbi:MAG: SoxR reducing system RseC family protein [Spirochaetaceae bacterium]|jgi:hypothetical protein|nr:SoxR reducing system RseC family protein [Spirochaetaceae bacterium]